jgi:hypothetical protein
VFTAKGIVTSPQVCALRSETGSPDYPFSKWMSEMATNMPDLEECWKGTVNFVRRWVLSTRLNRVSRNPSASTGTWTKPQGLNEAVERTNQIRRVQTNGLQAAGRGSFQDRSTAGFLMFNVS